MQKNISLLKESLQKMRHSEEASMKKNYIITLLVLTLTISIFPICTLAATDYSSWNGCWVADRSAEYAKQHSFESEYCIDFDSLHIVDYSISYGIQGKAYPKIGDNLLLTKVNEKTFTFKRSNVILTLALNDDGTITLSALDTNTQKASSDILRKDSTFLDRYKKLAAPTVGLASFTAAKSYNGGFTDVAQDSWYGRSVKYVYEFGVMNGTGTNTFDPDSAVSLAQAITVASRIHAQYYSKTISEISGTWYKKYISYATSNGLLPSDFSSKTNLESPATREFMAYVFSKAISQSDLPAVNPEVEIPDINMVSASYTEAVKSMYYSGIMTGTSGNYFNPSSQATRAQMATIIMRILQPSERITSDKKLDAELLENESNVMNKVPIFKHDNGDFLAFTYTGSQSSFDSSSIKAYLKYNDNVETFSGQNWMNLVYSDGYYYYSFPTYGSSRRLSVTLLKQGVTGGTSQAIYRTENGSDDISAITVYDGTVFFLQTGRDVNNKTYTSLYRISSDGKAELLTKVLGLGDKLAAFNDSIYFEVSSEIVAYSLSSRNTKDVLMDVSDWTMSAGIIYYLDYFGNVSKVLAELPESPKVLAMLPYGDYKGTMNYYKDILYIYPNYCAFGTLYTCDDNGLHSLYYLGNQAIYNLGISDFGLYYEDNSDSILYAILKGKIALIDNDQIPRTTLYEFFSKLR